MAGFGFVDLAKQGFRDAKAGFLALQVDGHAALTTLDLATVLMRQGKASEARKAAAEALQVFTRLRIPDTQVEALLVLAEALRSELLSAGLLQSIAEFFRRAEDRATALKFSAALSAASRDPLFRIDRDRTPAGFSVLSTDGREEGTLSCFHERALDLAHMADYCARSPYALAAVLEAAGPTTLRKAGVLLLRALREE